MKLNFVLFEKNIKRDYYAGRLPSDFHALYGGDMMKQIGKSHILAYIVLQSRFSRLELARLAIRGEA